MVQSLISPALRAGDQSSRSQKHVAKSHRAPQIDLVARRRVAMTYMANGPTIDKLVRLEQLVLIALYDDGTGHGRPAVRLAGYRGQHVPWGVSWGGSAQNVSFKDMLLRPTRRAQGPRLDLANDRLLRLGLRLDRHLQRHERYPHRPMAECPRLPPLMFAFRANDAHCLTGDGPEFETACRHTGRSAIDLLASSRCEHNGLVLLPLEWTSHAWQQAMGVFADLSCFPKLQVVSLTDSAVGLQGYQGAVQFDFHSSPFRSARLGGTRGRRQRRQQRLRRAAA